MNILLADNHALFRDSMSVWLKQLSVDINIQHAANFKESIAIINQTTSLQLALINLHMPGMCGAKSIKVLQQELQHTPLAIISADENPETIKQCMHAGATGYLPKTSSGKIILAAIHIMLSGGSYIPFNIINKRSPLPNFTNKQYQILELLSHGMSNKEIAYQTGLSEGSTKQYVSKIFKKLKARNRTQACTLAQNILGKT